MPDQVHKAAQSVESHDIGLLLEKVRKAKGPSRQIDAEIVVAFNLRPEWCGPAGELWVDNKADIGEPVVRIWSVGRRSSGCTPMGPYPEFSASIDAALALVERVLPGRSVLLSIYADGRLPLAKAEISSGLIGPTASAPTAPLAILAALLTALQSTEAGS